MARGTKNVRVSVGLTLIQEDVIELIRTASQKGKMSISSPPGKKFATAYGIELSEDAIGQIPAELDIRYRLYYHQNSDSLNARNGELWRLPDPSNHVQSERLFEHPIEKRYFKDLELIYKYWKCSEQGILPLGLRKTTPYSQAMLALLRRIACASRGDKKDPHNTFPSREQAHDALLRTVKARLQREDHGNLEMVISATPPHKLEHTTKQGVRTRTLEETAFLRRDGLTFEDAETVRAMLMSHKRAVKKARRIAANAPLRYQARATKNVAKVQEEPDLSDSDSMVFEDVETSRMASRPERKQKARWNVRRPSHALSDGEAAERAAKIIEGSDISDDDGHLIKDVEAAREARGLEIRPKSERNTWGPINAPLSTNVEEIAGQMKEELSGSSDNSDSDGGVELEGFCREFLR